MSLNKGVKSYCLCCPNICSVNKGVKFALKLINTGQWLQLEGSIGRWCNDLIESEIIIKDEKATKKKGPVKFRDGYGRWHNQYRFKINHIKLADAKSLFTCSLTKKKYKLSQIEEVLNG